MTEKKDIGLLGQVLFSRPFQAMLPFSWAAFKLLSKRLAFLNWYERETGVPKKGSAETFWMGTPQDYGLDQEGFYERKINTPQEKLTAWFKPPKSQDGPVVALFTGYAGHIAHEIPLMRMITSEPFNFGLATVSWPGYGSSTGSPSEASIHRAADYLIRYTLAKGIDEKPVKLDQMMPIGLSLGSSAVMKLSTKYKFPIEFDYAGFVSFEKRAEETFPLIPMKALLDDKFDNVEAMKKRKTSPTDTYFICCLGDNFTRPQHTWALYLELLKKASPEEMAALLKNPEKHQPLLDHTKTHNEVVRWPSPFVADIEAEKAAGHRYPARYRDMVDSIPEHRGPKKGEDYRRIIDGMVRDMLGDMTNLIMIPDEGHVISAAGLPVLLTKIQQIASDRGLCPPPRAFTVSRSAAETVLQNGNTVLEVDRNWGETVRAEEPKQKEKEDGRVLPRN